MGSGGYNKIYNNNIIQLDVALRAEAIGSSPFAVDVAEVALTFQLTWIRRGTIVALT